MLQESAALLQYFRKFSWAIWLWAVLFIFFTHWQSACAQSLQDDLIRRRYFEIIADRLYDTREIPNNLELAIQHYKKAIKTDPQRPGINWKISRCYWVLAERAAGDAERAKYYKQGTYHSKLAIEKDQKNSNAHLWYSLTTGSQALEKGVMNALYLRDELKSSLKKALDLNPKNVNALMGLASWYFLVPAIFGGDRSKTYTLIEEAIKIDPNYTGIRLRKAEMLMTENRYSEAADALQQLLKVQHPTLPGDGREDKAKARELMEGLKEKGKEI